LDSRAAGAKRLQGKVCIVTGAGQGIGRATARRLGAEGGKVVVAERIDETATRTTDELKAAGLLKGATPVVVLGEGDLTKRLNVTAHRFSAAAKAKIEAAGGTVTALKSEETQES